MTQLRPTIPALVERAVCEFGEDTYLVTPTERRPRPGRAGVRRGVPAAAAQADVKSLAARA